MKIMEVSPLIDLALQNKPMTVNELQPKVLHFVQVVLVVKENLRRKKTLCRRRHTSEVKGHWNSRGF
jgi:hypothetical protein